MSMWKVDDKVTQEFMTIFYEKWLVGRQSGMHLANATANQRKIQTPLLLGSFCINWRIKF